MRSCSLFRRPRTAAILFGLFRSGETPRGGFDDRPALLSRSAPGAAAANTRARFTVTRPADESPMGLPVSEPAGAAASGSPPHPVPTGDDTQPVASSPNRSAVLSRTAATSIPYRLGAVRRSSNRAGRIDSVHGALPPPAAHGPDRRARRGAANAPAPATPRDLALAYRLRTTSRSSSPMAAALRDRFADDACSSNRVLTTPTRRPRESRGAPSGATDPRPPPARSDRAGVVHTSRVNQIPSRSSSEEIRNAPGQRPRSTQPWPVKKRSSSRPARTNT